ncbi:Hypothetical predicted protein [Octopus vulgaris]|uniref:Methyltransferase domain-containing protein n=1 Tax=Octopus vulgaris TaxID=6645 RepID=A0AA36B443_OCTVU|nr:Hypothetical predicted protein [Octopus vulgaris]
MRQLINYPNIDPEISKAAAKTFSNHLRYLAPETVALSIFNDNVPTGVKVNIAQVMLETDTGKEEEEEKNQLKSEQWPLADVQKIAGSTVLPVVIPFLEELKTKTEIELEDMYHGIGRDSTFDVGMTNIFGCEVHSFDPFEKEVPNRKLINFHDIGISDKSGIDGGRQFMTLRDTRKYLNHTKKDISILKMDVESSEWRSLTKAMSDGELNHVKQLALEFHIAGKESATGQPVLQRTFSTKI